MQPCHTVPFVHAGTIIEPALAALDADDASNTRAAVESCDYCGSARLEWRKCKSICLDCRQINKSCADL
jgi:hypothetical protein